MMKMSDYIFFQKYDINALVYIEPKIV